MSTPDALFEKQLPASLEEDILNYLRQQERELQQNEGDQQILPAFSYSYSYGKPSTSSSSDHGNSYVKTILNDVLSAIERRGRLKTEYTKKLRAHNQFDLFNLSTIIPGFNIDDAMSEQLCFKETIIVGKVESNASVAPSPDPVGGICLNIQKAKGSHPLNRQIPNTNDNEIIAEEIKEIGRLFSGDELSSASAADLDEYKKLLQNEMKQEHCKFLVHLSSQFDHDGRNCGSRITCWVDRELHTLEENRREYLVETDGSLDEKTLYVALQTKLYYVKVSSTKDDLLERKFYKLDKTKNYISEGANFLLMRYLAITKYKGNFELSTMYISGDMCRNIYICTGPEVGVINNKKLNICKIQRIIIEECGNVHKCATILTIGGRIVKQDWENVDYVLYINPLLQITDKTPKSYENIPLCQRWEDDMQIFSQYLDSRNSHAIQTKSYLKDHPELNNLIADYVKKILHMKPKSVMNFSWRYFTQCLPAGFSIPRNEYWDETEPPLY